MWKRYKKINQIGNGIYGNIYKVNNKKMDIIIQLIKSK